MRITQLTDKPIDGQEGLFIGKLLHLQWETKDLIVEVTFQKFLDAGASLYI